MFLHLGYAECANGQFEKGCEKIALYAVNDTPKHAARQVSEDRWSSKVGKYIDIEHNVDALEGPAYGYVVKFFEKQTNPMGSSSSI